MSERKGYSIILIMKDPDSYRQQEGLKLTEEEKRRNSYPLRFFILATITYILFFLAIWFIFTPQIKENFKENRYIERLKAYRSEESAVYPMIIDSVLIGEDGLTKVSRMIPNLGRDHLHTTIEALLLPITEDEDERGLYSAIPEDTELVGITQKGKIILVELTPDFLDAEDLEAASAQIRETLSIVEDNLRVSIRIGDEII